jgi:Uma2 family endonuclease
MSTTTRTRIPAGGDRSLILDAVDWDQYRRMSDALVDRHNPRLIYLDGSLTLLVTSREHDWLANRLCDLVKAVATGCRILWEDAGQATYRRADLEAGIEGYGTFYFRDHAEIMKGRKNIDLTTQPPPDLAIEVEVSHPADKAVGVWGRLGVPEVWRLDAEELGVSVLRRNEGGTYSPIDRSAALAMLTTEDIIEQLRLSDSLGSAAWYAQLGEWVRQTLVPRGQGGE